MKQKPNYQDICERYAQSRERRLKEKGLTEEEYIEKRRKYEEQFEKKKKKVARPEN